MSGEAIISEFARSRLVLAAGDLWPAATRARFLDGVADGTLPADAFNRWLAQDYLFAQGLLAFQAVATGRMPRDAHATLIGGLVAMDEELSWFERHAQSRGVALDAAPHATCRRYTDFLIAAAYTQPCEVSLAVLYGVEVSYLVAWSALTPARPYEEFIRRWSNEAFTEYVRSLRELADRHVHERQQELFNEVLRHERDFWRMTVDG